MKFRAGEILLPEAPDEKRKLNDDDERWFDVLALIIVLSAVTS